MKWWIAMDLYLVKLVFVSAHYCSAPPTFNIPLAATSAFMVDFSCLVVLWHETKPNDRSVEG